MNNKISIYLSDHRYLIIEKILPHEHMPVTNVSIYLSDEPDGSSTLADIALIHQRVNDRSGIVIPEWLDFYIRHGQADSEYYLKASYQVPEPVTILPDKSPMERIFEDVKRQLESDCTCYGEPQAWVELPNGRTLEITHEEYNIPKENQYYSYRINCSEDEFESGRFDETNGVIDERIDDQLTLENLESLYYDGMHLKA